MKTLEEHRDYQRAWRKNNPERVRARDRRANLTRHGLTPESFGHLLIEQCGRCGICNCPMRSPVIDHSHMTGKVRGLLCDHCNLALGHLKDSLGSMRCAIRWVEDRS